MNEKLKVILRAMASSAVQIAVVLVVIVAAFLAYNAGARHGSAGHTAPTVSNVEQAPAAASHPVDANGDGVIFTCSMHPQIQQDEPGDCPICGMELVPLSVAAAPVQTAQKTLLGYACAMNCVPPLPEPGKCPICGMEMQAIHEESGGGAGPASARRLEMSAEAVALADIRTARVARAQPTRQLNLYGKLAVNVSRRAHISADVGGRIDMLSARFVGDSVTVGQPLISLYSPELLAVQRALLQARQLGGESAMASARERLRLAGMSDQAIADLEQGGIASENITIKSPIGGVVTERHAEEGQYVMKGDRVITIADLSVLWAQAEAFESDLPWIREGQPVTITTDSHSGEQLAGTVSWLSPTLNENSRTATVRVDLPNPGGSLKPGMYVRVLIRSEMEGGPALVIPESAPMITGPRALVYVASERDGRRAFEGREVTLGPRAEEGYVVLDGLAEGDEVVVNGAFAIDSSLQILAKKSMMGADDSAGGMTTAGHDHGSMAVSPADVAVGTHAKLSKEDFKAWLPQYLVVQRALASDDFEAARKGWDALRTIVAAKNGALAKVLDAGGDAASIKALRAAFEPLSESFIAAAKQHGNPLDVVLQLTHCPMALDWKGAYWLQSEEDVFNPYFGDEMLTCGQIMEEWPAP